MRAPVSNIHEVVLPASVDRVGAILDTLATDDDALWPTDRWPRMHFREGLRLGAAGGHGPIRYRLVEHHPGRRLRFAFMAPKGLEGDHWFEVIPHDEDALLRHGLVAHPRGAMRWQWPLVWRPLHDALVEDALARAVAVLAGRETDRSWPLHVRVLRRLARRT